VGRLKYIGAEMGNIAEYAASVGEASIDSAVKHSGSYSLKIDSVDGAVAYAKSTFAASATAYFSFYFCFGEIPAYEQAFFFGTGIATYPPTLRLAPDGTHCHINLWNVAIGGAKIASGSTPLAVDTQYRIDLKVGKGAAGACSYELWITAPGGIRTLEFSGTDGTFGTGDISGCYFGVFKDRADDATRMLCWFDDFFVRNDAFEPTGILRIFGFVPNGAGDNADKVWTGTPANTYADIDDTADPDDDTSYWGSTATGGHRFAAAPSCSDVGVPADAEILSVMWFGKAKCASAGPDIQAALNSGGTHYGTEFTPTTAYAYYRAIWDADPYTSAAWTRDGVDALEAGVGASQVGSVEVRVTMFMTMVAVREQVIVPMGVATVNGSAPAPAIVPGAVSIACQAAAATGAGQGIVASGGPVSIGMTVAEAAAAGQLLSVAPGAVIVPLSCAAAVADGPALSVSPGAVTLAMLVAVSTAGALAITIDAGEVAEIIIGMGTASASAAAQALSITPGAVIVQMDPAAAVAAVLKMLLRGGRITLPDGRTAIVPAEDRTVAVLAETRKAAMQAEPSRTVVPDEDRTATVDGEDRRPMAPEG
jgi:hypothetical protein